MSENKIKISGSDWWLLVQANLSCGAHAYENKAAGERLKALGLIELNTERDVWKATALGREVYERGGE
jgi:hypothetical protein